MDDSKDSIASPDFSHSLPTPEESYNLDRSICEFEVFEYYSEEDKYRAFYDADQDPPSAAVVSIVAAVSDTEPTEMDPLHAVIDADALDTLASPRQTTNDDIRMTFVFHGHEVTVSNYGCITVQPQSSPGVSSAADV